MSEIGPGETVPFEGEMYLYEQPELLDKEKHGHLGISKVDHPFEFARKAGVVPIAASEILTVQKYYPVVFSSVENPVLLAALGVRQDVNLFVDENGEWEKNSYIPAYLRCHPIAYAMQSNDRYAVVIDRAAAVISESPDQPFFDGDELSAQTQARVHFFSTYDAERERTALFCARLRDLGLLSGQSAVHRTAEKVEEIASYVAVDTEKIRDLDKDTLHELHFEGILGAIFGHLFSVENWYRLLERREYLEQARRDF